MTSLEGRHFCLCRGQQREASCRRCAALSGRWPPVWQAWLLPCCPAHSCLGPSPALTLPALWPAIPHGAGGACVVMGHVLGACRVTGLRLWPALSALRREAGLDLRAASRSSVHQAPGGHRVGGFAAGDCSLALTRQPRTDMGAVWPMGPQGSQGPLQRDGPLRRCQDTGQAWGTPWDTYHNV